MAGEFGLHPLAVEDAVKAHQRPKVEDYEDSLFVVLKTVRYDEPTQQVDLGDVMLFMGDSFVVTVRHGQARALKDVRRRLEVDRHLLDCGPSAVLYAVCDAVVDDYSDIAFAVEQDIEEVEERVFSPDRSNDAARIYNLKREVIEFRRAVHPLVEPMDRLAAGRVGRVHEHLGPSSATSPTTRRGSRSRSTASTTCSGRCSTPTSPRSPCSRTRTCDGSPRGSRSSRCPR